MKQFIVMAIAMLLLNSAKSQCIIQDAKHKDVYRICFNSNIKRSQFIIQDSTGKTLHTEKVWLYKGYNNTPFNAKRLPAGTYTIIIKDAFTGSITKS